MRYKLIKKLLFAALIFSLGLRTGCRDYVTGIGENEPPSLYTSYTSYSVNDSITVYLQNKSTSSIYVIGAFASLERNDAGTWSVYSQLTCSGICPEFAIPKKQTISNSIRISSAGTYRFVSLYSFTAGVENENKIKLYSNELTVN